ncbi:MAG TPA: OPT/YSL family transporter [Vicinamibacteria bacterium]
MLPEGEGGGLPERHPSIFEPTSLFFGVLFAILGTIIGLELFTRLGVAPNSSIIGVIATIALSRIPLAPLRRFRDLARQNLAATLISGATYGGANGILLPTGVLWLMGRRDLVPVMMVGAVTGVFIGAVLMYRLFDSRLFPASAAWPSGVATAECMIAGDRGGKHALLLAAGGVVGCAGILVGIPMDVFGICWIGNIWALFMFGLGLLVRGYSEPLVGIDIQAAYLPHGFMIGAGLVALAQIGYSLRRRTSGVVASSLETRTGATLLLALGVQTAVLLLMAIAAGTVVEMSPSMLVGFVLYAAVSALAAAILSGIAAMHSGWFPAFATALICLLVGMALGFPPLPLAFLVGFAASISPAFADMGYDLKAGWILRGRGTDSRLERSGRRAQLAAELLGIGVAALVVLLFHASYFERDLFPPYDRVAVATIAAGASPSLAKALVLWAIPGALLQLTGGPSRQLGVLLATGLLIDFRAAGWTAMVSLFIRFLLNRCFGAKAQTPIYVLAGGFIAGSALTSFGAATLKLR